MKNDIKKDITKMINKITGIEKDYGLKDQLKQDCRLDSLSLAQLIFEIEEEFAITFDDVDLAPSELITFSDLIKLTGKYV